MNSSIVGRGFISKVASISFFTISSTETTPLYFTLLSIFSVSLIKGTASPFPYICNSVLVKLVFLNAFTNLITPNFS